MKKFYRILLTFVIIALLMWPGYQAHAGNKDRSGQAGAPELLINPFAQGTGWASANTANVVGVESMFTNVAGLAFINKTELNFSYTTWLQGSEITIGDFGIAQRISETTVMGLNVMSMSFGKLDETTTAQPDGTGAQFSPNLMNISVALAKAFSNSIYGGFNLKIITQSIPDASAMGIAFDFGITYVTGKHDNAKFGVALKNIGPKMKFTGDGFTIKALFESSDYAVTVHQRSEGFEMPTQLRIGASYDFLMGEASRLTLAGTFASNSFTKDQFLFGAEFSLKDYLMLRAGYTYENDITSSIEGTDRTNVYNGPSAGMSLQVPFNKETGAALAVDYSYQTTAHFNGTHVFGVRVIF